MDRTEPIHARLREHLDPRGDLAPPWERFPDYEHGTIGWRMGSGESWLMRWGDFLEGLAPDSDTRLAYLRRHAPAPVSWAESVYGALHPEADDCDDPAEEARRRAELLDLGLIASDIAFTTWLDQQEGVRWPWERRSKTPEDAARYDTRAFWFWSRQVAGIRKEGWEPPEVPAGWQACADALRSGNAGPIDPRLGLLSLARMLCAGRVQAPWQLGLTPADFKDSFETDMGYVDVFRLWGMSAFDDAPHLRRYLEAERIPQEWEPWVEEHLSLD